jgi:peroxin-2
MALMNLRYRNEVASRCSSTPPMATPFPAVGVSMLGGHSGMEGPGLSFVQRVLYCLGAVLGRYVWARVGHHAASSHWGDVDAASWRGVSWRMLHRADTAYQLASLVNYVAFLKMGR